MNSLPLMTEIIRPGEVNTMIIFDVLPVAQFANTMYWHDTKDKSLISLGSLKISRVYHCTYASFMKRLSADETALLHYDGTYVINDQIVTVVEFVAQIGFSFEPKEEKKPVNITAFTSIDTIKDSYHSLVTAVGLARIQKEGCKTCAEYSGVKDSSLRSESCVTCSSLSNWKNPFAAPKPAARPEPENINETPSTICSTCSKVKAFGQCDDPLLLNLAHTACPEWLPRDCKTCAIPRSSVVNHRAFIPIGVSDITIQKECRTCGENFKNWIPK